MNLTNAISNALQRDRTSALVWDHRLVRSLLEDPEVQHALAEASEDYGGDRICGLAVFCLILIDQHGIANLRGHKSLTFTSEFVLFLAGRIKASRLIPEPSEHRFLPMEAVAYALLAGSFQDTSEKTDLPTKNFGLWRAAAREMLKQLITLVVLARIHWLKSAAQHLKGLDGVLTDHLNRMTEEIFCDLINGCCSCSVDGISPESDRIRLQSELQEMLQSRTAETATLSNALAALRSQANPDADELRKAETKLSHAETWVLYLSDSPKLFDVREEARKRADEARKRAHATLEKDKRKELLSREDGTLLRQLSEAEMLYSILCGRRLKAELRAFKSCEAKHALAAWPQQAADVSLWEFIIQAVAGLPSPVGAVTEVAVSNDTRLRRDLIPSLQFWDQKFVSFSSSMMFHSINNSPTPGSDGAQPTRIEILRLVGLIHLRCPTCNHWMSDECDAAGRGNIVCAMAKWRTLAPPVVQSRYIIVNGNGIALFQMGKAFLCKNHQFAPDPDFPDKLKAMVVPFRRDLDKCPYCPSKKPQRPAMVWCNVAWRELFP